MRRTLLVCLLAIIALPNVMRLGAVAAAPGDVAVMAARLTIDGTSTMHDYTLVTTALNVVSSAIDTGSLLEPAALQHFELQIPVNSFMADRDGLKKKMLETIQAEKHPFITFKLDNYSVDGTVTRVNGTLTVAGVAKPIDLELQVDETTNGVHVRGTHDLSMKEFGIKAPTMFMGMLKTHDQVTIKFELQLVRATKASN